MHFKHTAFVRRHDIEQLSGPDRRLYREKGNVAWNRCDDVIICYSFNQRRLATADAAPPSTAESRVGIPDGVVFGTQICREETGAGIRVRLSSVPLQGMSFHAPTPARPPRRPSLRRATLPVQPPRSSGVTPVHTHRLQSVRSAKREADFAKAVEAVRKATNLGELEKALPGVQPSLVRPVVVATQTLLLLLQAVRRSTVIWCTSSFLG